MILTEEGDSPAARRVFERALAIMLGPYGPKHPAVADRHNQLGTFFHPMGEYERAIGHYRRALEIREERLDPGSRAIATVRNNLANSLYETGGHAAARPAARAFSPISRPVPLPTIEPEVGRKSLTGPTSAP